MIAETSPAVRLGSSDTWLSLAPHAGCLQAGFQARGLKGAWTTDEVDLTATGLELQALHDSLSGEVLLSDNSSLGIRFAVNKLGHVTADVHIEGWPFQVEGRIRLELAVEHGQLTQLSQSLSGVVR